MNSEDAQPPHPVRAAPLSAKEEMADFARTALIAVFLALFIRTFFYEPFNIPSGSMKPTLEIGDYLFVHKPSYGYSRFSFPFGFAPIEGRIWSKPPSRGDVIVFKLPTNTGIDYIKRVIGLPGDRIQMRGGRLYINDKLVRRERLRTVEDSENPGQPPVQLTEYRETLPGGAQHLIYEESDGGPLDNTDVYTVPEGHYFGMGDNRDNSQDSRVTSLVGYIPFENLVGRADFIFFSASNTARFFEVWKWPWAIRYNRFFRSLAPSHETPPGNPAVSDAP